jgi:hypothetical protein
MEQTTTSPQSQPLPQQPEKVPLVKPRQFPTFWVGIIIVLSLGLVLVGYQNWQLNQKIILLSQTPPSPSPYINPQPSVFPTTALQQPTESIISWKSETALITANTMGEARDYAYILMYPSNWQLTKDVSLHTNDNLVTNCADYNLISPSGNSKLSVLPVCTSYVGKNEILPTKYEVIKKLGQIGNDTSYKYVIRFLASGTTYQYGVVASISSAGIVATDKVEKQILVTYAPDDYYFIPTTIRITTASAQDLQIADQIVTKLVLERR